jgi:hypothetical protein
LEDNRVREVSLTQLQNGELELQFKHHLQKIVDDLLDPNKMQGDKRSISIEITFNPITDKKDGSLSYLRTSSTVKSKLAKEIPVESESKLYLNKNGRNKGVFEVLDIQPSLPMDAKDEEDNVLTLKGVKNA